MFRFLPEQASEFADKVDWVNNLITDISVFFTVAIVGAMLFFAVRYRRRNGVDHATPQIEGNSTLEIIWTVVPTIICVIVAYYGIVFAKEMRTPPKDAMAINVIGQKWKWDFEYDTGKRTSNEFVVPVNKPVKLILQSRDVLHSFFVPTMRVKMDAVPGQFTYLWFKPVKTGTYQAFCTEYCGKDHSAMMAKVRVVPEAEFARWVNDRTEEEKANAQPPAENGKNLYVQKGCNACHSVNGSRLVGPSFLKIVGREGKLADGKPYVADENYIKNSILNPNDQIVETYPPNMMPSFQGQLSDKEISDLIAFMRGLETAPAEEAAAPAAPAARSENPAERGKVIYETKLCVTCHSLDGSKLIGPSFQNIYGKKGKLVDGSEYEANDDYIKNSVLKPTTQVVEGYPPVMPSFEGQLNDEDLKDLIEFLKTVK